MPPKIVLGGLLRNSKKFPRTAMSPETKVLYEFGRFRCDPAENLSFCEGKAVSLSPKAFETLIILIKSNGRLLTKDEMMQKVWPDTFVEDANLTINISAFRKVSGRYAGRQQDTR